MSEKDKQHLRSTSVFRDELQKMVIKICLMMEKEADPYVREWIGIDPRWEKFTKKYRKSFRGFMPVMEDTSSNA